MKKNSGVHRAILYIRMLTRRQPLFWLLLIITTSGDSLVINAFRILYKGNIPELLMIAELALIGMIVTPWSIKMPSGAAWRPGIPLMLMSIFLVRPDLVVVVNIAGPILITARARGAWWKYFETIAHAALGLYIGACTYTYLEKIFQFTPFGRIVAVILALFVHLVVNRFISSVIVAHREHRPLIKQIRLILSELHWGYFNAYLLIVMASMLNTQYMPLGIFVASLIQSGIFIAVSNYSTIKTLQNSVRTDGLTSLENRVAWEELLDDRQNKLYEPTLFVIDINDFKDINDRYGHLVGDHVLREMAHVLQVAVPKRARIFRIGGDEFVVYLATKKEKEKDISKRIREQTVERFSNFHQIEETVTISIGEATSPEDGERLIDLFLISDKRMYEDKRHVRYTESGLDFGIPASILSLVLALESRDTYTSGHSLRVAFYAWKLGMHMKLEIPALQSIFRAGLVHDVGKIGVPDAILNKQGKLSDDEFRIIQQHPETGYEMCRKLSFSRDELDIIRYHHERWDGSGYPLGLSVLDIPLLSRITTVADVYDALTSTRSYRSAWSHQQAIQYIIENRNMQFDPVCVDSWVELNEISLLSQDYIEWVKDAKIVNHTGELYAI